MSFFTSLSHYRPGSPPSVTADDLSRFIAQISETSSLTDSGLRLLQVKFGDSIDQDDKGTTWEEESVPGISMVHDIEWDLDLSSQPTHQQMVDSLASDQRRIYRAFVMLGMPIDDVLQPITRENSPENEINYYPDGLSVEIGPIKCYDMASEEPLHVGWISLSLSGGGYLFPWTFRDAHARLQDSSQIRRLADLCRSFWPVALDSLDPQVIQLRKKLNELWPYDQFDQPLDWCWGLQESG